MRPVAEGKARFMRMEGEDIPKENRKIDFVEDRPSERSGLLPDRHSLSASLGHNSPPSRVRGNVYIVGQGQPGASPTPISKVSSYPYGMRPTGSRRSENAAKCLASLHRGTGPIENGTAIGVGVEHVLEGQPAYRGHELRDGFHQFSPRVRNSTLRRTRSPSTVPPPSFLTWRKTS